MADIATSNTVYNDVEYIFTEEGKSGVIKQNNGYKFSVIGAVLFSDKDGWVQARYLRNSDTKANYLDTVTWEKLQEKTQIIFTKIPYEYNGFIYTPNEELYNTALQNPLNYLLQVKLAYSNIVTEDSEGGVVKTKYVSYDTMVRTDTLQLINNQNVDFLFDGIAVLAVPYKTEKSDLYHPLINKQDIFILNIEYFPTEKIKVLHNQSRKLVFNTEIHIFLEKDLQVKNGEELKPYNAGIHLVNDGSSNTIHNGVKSLGGITKLLLR